MTQRLYELAYRYIADTAKVAYENGVKIKCGELLVELNNFLPPSFQYGSLRGSVFKAAWRRTDDFGKEAMENVFIDKNGNALL